MRLVLACLAVIALIVGIIRGSDADDGSSDGVRLTYSMDLEAVPDDDATIGKAIGVIHARIGQRGFPVRIHRLADGIAVELPELGDDELAVVQNLISRRAQLELKIVDASAEYMRTLAERVHYDTNAGARDITAEVDSDTGRDGSFQAWYLKAPDREERLDPDEAQRIGCREPPRDGKHPCRVTGRDVIERYVLLDPAFAVPSDRELAYELIVAGGNRRPSWRTHYLERAPVITGAAIKSATVTHDPTAGMPQVLLELTPDAAAVFADVTGRRIGSKLAIVVDDRVLSAPVIQDRIVGGTIAISMGGTDPVEQQRQAEELVAALRGGSLPAPLQLEYKEPFRFPASGSFINQSWMFFAAAGLLGLAAVVISLRSRKSRARQGVSAETPGLRSS